MHHESRCRSAGKPDSVHLREIPQPKLNDQPHPHVCKIPEGRAVLVKTLQIGVDATDRKSTRRSMGTLLRVANIWSSGTKASAKSSRSENKVTEFKVGDYVSCTVRRPGGSLFDTIGRNDITTKKSITNAASTCATAT